MAYAARVTESYDFGVCDDLVARIAGGDPAALAEAYNEYAPGLYAYCRALLREPADAADAVHDTFLIAVERVEQLRDQSRLRPWLYTVARNECIRRSRRQREIPAEHVPEMSETVDLGAAAEQAELAALIRDAAAGVNPAERKVLYLQLHDLGPAEVVQVLGIRRNHLSALASRARTELSACLGVLLVARTGQEDCAELRNMLAGWDGQLTPRLRRSLSRHLDRCAACRVCRQRELTPAILAGVGVPLAAVGLPAALHEQVIHAATSADVAVRAHRAALAARAGPFKHHGFPARMRGLRAWHHPRAFRAGTAGTAATAAAAAIILVVGGGTHSMPVPGRPAVSTPASPGARPGVPAARTSPGGGPGAAAPAAGARLAAYPVRGAAACAGDEWDALGAGTSHGRAGRAWRLTHDDRAHPAARLHVHHHGARTRVAERGQACEPDRPVHRHPKHQHPRGRAAGHRHGRLVVTAVGGRASAARLGA